MLFRRSLVVEYDKWIIETAQEVDKKAIPSMPVAKEIEHTQPVVPEEPVGISPVES